VLNRGGYEQSRRERERERGRVQVNTYHPYFQVLRT